MMKKRFAIFGGTFDPWTKAHQWIVNRVIDNDIADVVIISPTIVDWHRVGKDKWLSDEDKSQVIESALEANGWMCHEFDHQDDIKDGIKEFFRVKDSKKVILSTRDFLKRDMLKKSEEQSGIINEMISEHRFIHTLIDLKLAFGMKNDWNVIIGTDSIKHFRSWYQSNDIINNASIVGVDGRDDDNLNKNDYEFVKTWIKAPEELMHISASKLREKYRNEKDGANMYILNEFQQEEKDN